MIEFGCYLCQKYIIWLCASKEYIGSVIIKEAFEELAHTFKDKMNL